MPKVPFQPILVVVVLTLIVLSNFLPIPGGGDGKSSQSSNTVGYQAPEVATGDQYGYIILLRMDKGAIGRASSSPGGAEAVSTSIQSYNAIARQISPSYLKKFGLATCLK